MRLALAFFLGGLFLAFGLAAAFDTALSAALVVSGIGTIAMSIWMLDQNLIPFAGTLSKADITAATRVTIVVVVSLAMIGTYVVAFLTTSWIGSTATAGVFLALLVAWLALQPRSSDRAA